MAKIYSPPTELASELPKLDIRQSFDQYTKAEDAWTEKLRAWVKQRNSAPECGEIIYFPVADGRARYMVASMKPVALIHLPLGDAWHFQYANRLTAADVRKQIRRDQALDKLFNRKGA